MKISSISSEVGVALHPAALTKRADSTAGETATFANRTTNRSEPVFIAAELGPAHGSNQDEAEGPIPPVVNGQGQGLKFSVDEETGPANHHRDRLRVGRNYPPNSPGRGAEFFAAA